jgi:hypothetical protein
MPIIGLQTRDGLVSAQDALATALLAGDVDGYPLPALMRILSNRSIEYPTASQLSGGAWRKCVLEKHLDYYVRPGDMLAALRGNMVHSLLEGAVDTEELTAERRLEYTIPGTDIFLSGQIDAYYPKAGRLDDYKSVKEVPLSLRDYHLEQLAIYKWLLEWSGYPVKQAGIVYITWTEMQRVTTCTYNNKRIQVIAHPLLADEENFLQWIQLPWTTLKKGFDERIVPQRMYCSPKLCNYCSVKWACDNMPNSPFNLNPKDWKQEEW